MPALLVERLLGLTYRRHQLLTRHGLIHLVFLLGGLAVFAMLVFLLHPRLYAHSFFNSKDIPFASMFLIALLLIHRAFRQDTVAGFVALGVGVGVATNLRIMGMVLVSVVVALRAGDCAWPPRPAPYRVHHGGVRNSQSGDAVCAGICGPTRSGSATGSRP